MAGLFDPKGLGLALGMPPSPLQRTLLGEAFGAVKRKGFFSFHYDDIMRVNNVRNAWKIDHPDSAQNRSFYDSSLWESKKLEGDEAVKRLIREGVEYTSAVCVLVGTETWSRRWCRYEIARAVIDGRGLLAVHINGIKHHQQPYLPHVPGPNPLDYMAIGAMEDGTYRLFEWKWVPSQGALAIAGGNWGWHRYGDYTSAVRLPRYLLAPLVGQVRPLSAGAPIYNWATQGGHKNLGAWIDAAAKAAGR